MFWKKDDTSVEKIVLCIEKMHCNSCAFNIDTTLEELSGVVEAKTSYARSQTEVTYDPDKTSVDQMITAITSMGYAASTKNQS